MSESNSGAWGKAWFRSAGGDQNEAMLGGVPESVPAPADINSADMQSLVTTWAASVPNT